MPVLFKKPTPRQINLINSAKDIIFHSWKNTKKYPKCQALNSLEMSGLLTFRPSQASISQPGDGAVVALAIVNTILGACAGGLVVLFVNRFPLGQPWSFLLCLNGALTGKECAQSWALARPSAQLPYFLGAQVGALYSDFGWATI